MSDFGFTDSQPLTVTDAVPDPHGEIVGVAVTVPADFDPRSFLAGSVWMQGPGVSGAPYMEVHCPHGGVKTYATEADLPHEDDPMPCGVAACWAIRYRRREP